MIFRRAILDDLPKLNYISVESKKYWQYPDEWIQKWKPDLMIAEEDLAENSITVAVSGENVVGFCAILEHREKYEIIHLWLLPEFIGKGFGKLLLEEALKNAINEPKPVIVESDPNAEAILSPDKGLSHSIKVESYPPGRFLPLMKKT